MKIASKCLTRMFGKERTGYMRQLSPAVATIVSCNQYLADDPNFEPNGVLRILFVMFLLLSLVAFLRIADQNIVCAMWHRTVMVQYTFNEIHALLQISYRNVFRNASIIIGMLKIGYKNLYLMDTAMRPFQTTPLCILDFFVHEDYQRKGYGHTLFDYMLKVPVAN